MADRPYDTSRAAHAEQLAVLKRLGPESRVRAALEMSDALRSIRIDGIMARNPDWTREQATRDLVASMYGQGVLGGS